MSIDERLRTAFRDLDRHVELSVGTPVWPQGRSAGRPNANRTLRHLLPVLAAAAVAAVLVVTVLVVRPDGLPLRTPDGAGPQFGGGASSAPGTVHASADSSPSVGPVVPVPPSQSPIDATRDRVPSVVAALPLRTRLSPTSPVTPGTVTTVRTSEGVWVASRLSTDIEGALGVYEYGELLLLTPARDKILRAYPLQAVPPRWLVVGPDAVYCGRQGDGGLPDSMVCRVDRRTWMLRVRIFRSPVDSAGWAPSMLRDRPGTWTVDDVSRGAVFGRARLSGAALTVTDHDGSLRLDPLTLAPR